MSRLADAVLLLGQHDDRAALGRLVGERGELRRVGELASVTPGAGMNSVAMRLPSVIVPVLSSSSTSTSPAASTARPAHREHVALHQPVHAGDADRRQQAADRRRDQADEQRDQHRDRDDARLPCLPREQPNGGSVTTTIMKISVRPRAGC
jgi:hypothetical protein